MIVVLRKCHLAHELSFGTLSFSCFGHKPQKKRRNKTNITVLTPRKYLRPFSKSTTISFVCFNLFLINNIYPSHLYNQTNIMNNMLLYVATLVKTPSLKALTNVWQEWEFLPILFLWSLPKDILHIKIMIHSVLINLAHVMKIVSHIYPKENDKVHAKKRGVFFL